jgi:hypothetical protein
MWQQMAFSANGQETGLSSMPRGIKIAVLMIGLVFGPLLTVVGPARADSANANDTARLLAGLPLALNSPLARYENDPAWKQHAQAFNSAWKKLDDGQLKRVRAWSEANLKNPQQTLFYTFSGPDFLYADAFFPKARTYVLAGLEAVGNIPEINERTRHSLSDLRASMSTILNISFFITRHMREQLHDGTQLTGTLPLLYVFLARAGKEIKDVTLIHLESDGSTKPADRSLRGRAFGKTGSGVKIDFSDADGTQRTLYYFSTDLSDPGVKTTGFLPFCQKLAPGDAFLKSASYLMHGGAFDTIRDFLVANSRTIVQDDSGIPLRSFKAGEWTFHPFGNYLHPLGIFPNTYQPRLKEMFAKAPKLDFGVGYRHRPNESNLMIATRNSEKAGQ